MSPGDVLWQRIQRKAGTLSPDLARDLLAAWQRIRASLSDAQLVKLITEGRLDGLIDQALLERVFQPARRTLADSLEAGIKRAATELPKSASVGIGFDVLSPEVIDAIRSIDSKVFATLKDDVREVVRAYVENGLRDGVGPRTITRGLRDIIGLAPNQAEYVANLRAELESGNYADAARRALIDRRFNLAKLDSLSADVRSARIDTIVNAYRKSYITFNAETNARTATLDALKEGQRLSWQQGIDNELVDPSHLVKTWVGVKDTRERPEHWLMEGETVPYDAAYSNGEYVPGESTFNCRCISRYHLVNDVGDALQPGADPRG